MSNPGSDFGRELLACAIDGTDPDEQPLRHVADLPPRRAGPQAWPQWADPDVVRAFVDRGIEAPWSHQLAAADLAHDGRHVVLSTGTASGKSLAYQLPILTALKDESAGAGPVPVADQGARPRPTAVRDRAYRSRAGAGRRRTEFVRRRQSRRGAALRARAFAVDLLQSRHDSPVAAAQPRPLGGVPAQSADSSSSTNATTTAGFSARTWRWCCAACCGCAPATLRLADGDLRQRDHRAAGGHRLGTASGRPSRRSPTTARRRAHARSRCGSRHCATTSSAKTALRYGVRRAPRPRV